MAKRGHKKGVKRRRPSVIAKLKADIARLSLENKTETQIAQDLTALGTKISQQMVHHYLVQIREQWLTDAEEEVKTSKARELAKIDHLERIYYEAWYRSIGELKDTRAKKERGDMKGETEKTEIRKFSTMRDPRYLAGIQWCIEQRCKIRGIEAPKAMRFVGFNFDPSKCSLEQLERLSRGEDPILVLSQLRPESAN